MKNQKMKKMISVIMSVLMLLTCFAFALPASAAEEEHECVWEIVDISPPKEVNGEWGNGYVTYQCQYEGCKKTTGSPVARADYSAYDAILAELNALLAESTLSQVSREEIEAVLAEYSVKNDLITLQQDQVDAAVVAITQAVGKYVEEFTVTFVDADGTVLSEQEVTFGFDAVAPAVAFKQGFVFMGWDKDYTNITAKLTVTAQYFEGRGYIDTDISKLGIQPGTVNQINAVLVTDEDIDKTITWTVADTSVATVDANGVVTAGRAGYTTLTLSAMEGAVQKTIDLYVYDGKADYTITLVNSGMGNFIINGKMVGIAFVKVKSGQRFRFQFALNSKYNPADVIITANGKEVVLGADNYFEIPYVCEDMTVMASLRELVNDNPGNGNNNENKPASCSCMCHSDGGIFGFLWDLLSFFCKLLGLENFRYCECGVAHW
ncbi:MAG: Ig-like domain-containing protein [Clostridia bacterium]|nr:Ig-like domain-containing protein [Clostridia bacterium]